jgi:hypothetical protein
MGVYPIDDMRADNTDQIGDHPEFGTASIE